MDLVGKRIFVAGHNGMVGAAIVRALHAAGADSIITASRAELDCVRQGEVEAFFESQRPDVVIIAAAKVGGIHANATYPADFIYDNLMIEANLINAAHRHGVEQLLFLGSSCIYPRDAAQPMLEAELLSGHLEKTNEPYAVAKIAGIKLCESYNRQHGRDYRSLMPTNLYGPGDNFHPENSHVIPGLMQRIHAAKLAKEKSVAVWGTGNARREFLHVDDLAAACVFCLSLSKAELDERVDSQMSHINVGTGVDVSIGELAQLISDAVGFEGTLAFDNTKPDGTPRKLLDTSLIASLGWQPTKALEEGLSETYAWYLGHVETLRH